MERVSTCIDAPYNSESLVRLLQHFLSHPTEYTHSDFADWHSDYWQAAHYEQIDLRTDIDKKAIEVAGNVDARWVSSIVNTYSQDELGSIDSSKVKLPREWFEDWLNRLVSS